MNVEEFFNLFIKELEAKPTLWSYYKYHNDSKSFEFRKAYFCQRLEYIQKAIRQKPSIKPVKYDYIIVQDTLHHLEPLQDALKVISDHLYPNGEIVAVEENGSNLIQSLKLYKQRGNKRIIEFYDERLKKTILLGNENIRSIQTWQDEMNKQGLEIDMNSLQYVRAYPPFLFNKFGYEKSIEMEQQLWKKNKFMREYFFFGINFIAKHSQVKDSNSSDLNPSSHALNH
ncbi:MAG: class I SAM-dependent methyltransferase [Bacteroidetes bacterium]|nr:class I SAM-dependent methyltransferase [Bacteroidota bacterium]